MYPQANTCAGGTNPPYQITNGGAIKRRPQRSQQKANKYKKQESISRALITEINRREG